MSGIVFQVETARVLQLLTKEIYDSPLAMLRENLQNAYDAIRMRFAPNGVLAEGGRIDVNVVENHVTIVDNGVGMTEDTLRNNFWKAGSSGKHSDAARRAGVVGTFGIGAMANFGVCDTLTVETRAEGSDISLRSTAELASLKLGEECIALEPAAEPREVGTKVTAILSKQSPINVDQARSYLMPYVALLPVPVYLNNELISRAPLPSRLPVSGRTFNTLGQVPAHDNLYGGTFEAKVDTNGQVLVEVTAVTLAGGSVEGNMTLLQSGGPLMGLRSGFGLAPVPAVGTYQFGGFADLSFLQPTAGREALSRESIVQITKLVNLAERAASELLAPTEFADRNTSFMQWILAHGRYDLARRVTIHCLPQAQDIEMGDITEKTRGQTVHYYTGTDNKVLSTFANEQSVLLQVAQASPRRKLQINYVNNQLHIAQVPDTAQLLRVYSGSELSAAEASILVRTGSVLRDDYLMADSEVVFADISHGVTILPIVSSDRLRLHISRSSSLLPPLVEFYVKAYDVFGQFIKDFVRVHIYPSIQQHVPSSTRGGVDALRKLLQRNRELYRYEETERGDLEGLLGEYLRDNAKLSDVINAARSAARAQTQYVSSDQVGTIESVVPDVVRSPVVQSVEEGAEFNASPPIVRDDVASDMKILTATEKHLQLNQFLVFLGLSDRLMRTEAEFFRTPHTTRILWGGHRVTYIFTETLGRLSLYYDIELREPIDRSNTSGGMFRTTTLITKRRIFVPVPDALIEAFQVDTGPKEFYVRFDLLSADID